MVTMCACMSAALRWPAEALCSNARSYTAPPAAHCPCCSVSFVGTSGVAGFSIGTSVLLHRGTACGQRPLSGVQQCNRALTYGAAGALQRLAASAPAQVFQERVASLVFNRDQRAAAQ